MQSLRSSPFKVNRIEKDPNAFGLRPKEIIECAEAIYNNRSILISGPRGIGKSSLGEQMQTVISLDSTLLRRCGYEAQFSPTYCIYYACGPEVSLEQLVLDLLYNFEQELRINPKLKLDGVKPSFELNFGIIKATVEAQVNSNRRSPATVASQFVNGIQYFLRDLTAIGYVHLNIMLDELDRLPKDINFGNFIKIVHETLDRKSLSCVTFIFAGQSGIYTRLLSEHESFDRIVRHIPLSTLDYDASRYILNYAAKFARPHFTIDEDAETALIGIAAGHPDILHLLGDAAYLQMQDTRFLTRSDVVNGVMSVLQVERREKYTNLVRTLTRDEKILIFMLASFETEVIPCKIPTPWILARNKNDYGDKVLDDILSDLVQKGILLRVNEGKNYQFTEELLRLFLFLCIEEEGIRQLIKNQRENKKHNQKLYPHINKADISTATGFTNFQDRLDKEGKRTFGRILRMLNKMDEDQRQDFILGLIEDDSWFTRGKDVEQNQDLYQIIYYAVSRKEHSNLLGMEYSQVWDIDSEFGDFILTQPSTENDEDIDLLDSDDRLNIYTEDD